ncbi:MAG: hypothetical protein ACO25B_04510 [Chitinophagaceae bacterium]
MLQGLKFTVYIITDIAFATVYDESFHPLYVVIHGKDPVAFN